MRVFERLGSIQFDPLEVAGRNHDLVLLARIHGYRREWTDALLYEERRLYESYNKGLSLLPVSELPWFRLTWDRNQARHEGSTFVEHAPLVEELLERIRSGGPLSSTDVETRASIDWFWRPTNQVRAVLEALAMTGRLGLARRQGNRRYYDLAERLFDPELLARRPDPHEQARHRLLSRVRAQGLLGRSGTGEVWYGTAPGTRKDGYEGPTRRELHDELEAAGELVPVVVEGLKGERFVLGAEAPDLVERPEPAEPGVAFLAPLDPLVWDRDLLRKLFDFDYLWEVYVPEAKRRWGYYVLPLLYGDRFVGRIEPRIDRRGRTLRVLGVWWEPGFDPRADERFAQAFAAALEAHQAFGDLDSITFERPRERALAGFVGEVRRLLSAPRGRAAVGR